MSGARRRVVIVGAGFGGLTAAKALKRAAVDVTVLDRRNHHLFQPLLYQVATAALADVDIAAPIRKVLRDQRNARVLLAEVRAVDVARRVVVLDDGEVGYDFLILAPGATDTYFGHDEWRRHAPGLKTMSDALEIRRRILLAFESAEKERDDAARREWLTFVIVGGGPTGVELAGAVAEIARHTLARDFRAFDPRDTEVLLIEGRDRVLPAYPPDLSAKAQRQLERLGVTVRRGALVRDIGERHVDLEGERIATRTVVWAAGVKAEPITATLGAPQDRTGRVQVEPDLSIPGHPEVLVIGDAALVRHGDGEVPGVAPAAMQMGRHAARLVRDDLAGRARRPFRYVDKGSMATIGRAAAVAVVGALHVSGPLAWLMWLFVHIFFLIGFRNRIVVLFEWGWAYVTYQRSARVILPGR